MIEFLIVLAILGILTAIYIPAYHDHKHGVDERLTQICVAQVQELPDWTDFSPTRLRELAMSYAPVSGVEITHRRLRNTREACFDRLVDASARRARLLDAT